MARLEEFMTSLATIVVRYHDSQKKYNVKLCVKDDSSPEKAREFALTLLKSNDFDRQLKELSFACTKAINYPDRFEFLIFITDEIFALKKLMDRTTAFTSSELQTFENKITRLLVDLKTLLATPKAKAFPVQVEHLDGTPITALTLKGMFDVGTFSSTLCSSGVLIRDELLKKLRLDENSTNETISEVAEILCQNYQIALLQRQNEESNKKIQEQERALQQKDKTIQEQEIAMKQKDAELAAAKKREDELTAKLTTSSKAEQPKPDRAPQSFASAFLGGFSPKITTGPVATKSFFKSAVSESSSSVSSGLGDGPSNL